MRLMIFGVTVVGTLPVPVLACLGHPILCQHLQLHGRGDDLHGALASGVYDVTAYGGQCGRGKRRIGVWR